VYCVTCGSRTPVHSSLCAGCGSSIRNQPQAQPALFEAVGVGWYFAAYAWLVISIVPVLFFDDLFKGMLVGTVLMYGGIILFSAGVIGRGKLTPERLVGSIPSHYNWCPAISLVIAMIVYSLSAEWISHYPIAINWPETYQEFLNQPLFLTRQDVANPVPYNILMLITLVIIAPVVEEVFFRMLLFPRLSVRWGTVTGIIVSSLMFALLHDMAWVGAFVFGVASCTLYMHTRTILVPIAVHSLNNAIAAAVAWWARSHGWDTTFDLSALQTELYIALILLVLASPVVFGLIGRWWPARGDLLPYFANHK
jgi:membrane protease YdiL (CAAX protease family)